MLNRKAPAFVLSIALALVITSAARAPHAVNAQGAAPRTLFDGANACAQLVQKRLQVLVFPARCSQSTEASDARPLQPEFSLVAELPPRRCLPVVPACPAPPCASHQLLAELSPASVEADPSGAPPGAAAPDEIIWVRYFGFGGFNREQALINDRATGLNPDYALSWVAPPVASDAPIPVWAIVQDNRGGTSVARWDFLVRTEPAQ